MKVSTKDLVYIGLLAALCAIATTIRVPVPGGAMVHLGSAALFTSSILFGGVYGGIAGAIGSGLFDMVMGHSQYTLFSIVIKGLAGLIVGVIATGYWPPTGHTPHASLKRIFLALLAGTVWTAIGYFFAWWSVLQSVTIAFGNIPFSLITSAAGIVVALILTPKLQKIIRR